MMDEFFAIVPRAQLEALPQWDGYLHWANRRRTLRRRSAAVKRPELRSVHGRHDVHHGRADKRPPFATLSSFFTSCSKLRNAGNTLVIIEHQLDVINARYVIDLGPEGGEAAGKSWPRARQEFVAAQPASHTGKFLKKVLEK